MPPILTTARLRLRELAADDQNNIKRIVGDYEVSKWLVPVPYPYESEDATTFICNVKKGNLGFVWAIEFKDKFVGVVGIGPELGYWLCPSTWGKGLMTEAVCAAINSYFTTTEAEEIPSSYFNGNTGSARVLKKAGFIETENGVSFSRARNKTVASQRLVLTRDRWLKHT